MNIVMSKSPPKLQCRLEHESPGPEVIELFLMLNSVEHEILNAHKLKNIKKVGFF